MSVRVYVFDLSGFETLGLLTSEFGFDLLIELLVLLIQKAKPCVLFLDCSD